MNKQKKSADLFDNNLTIEAILWTGGIDPDLIPYVLKNWADVEMLQDVGVNDADDLLAFLDNCRGDWPYLVLFQWVVPRCFDFNESGEPKSWCLGGVYREKVVAHESLAGAISAGVRWAKAEFAAEVKLAKGA